MLSAGSVPSSLLTDSSASSASPSVPLSSPLILLPTPFTSSLLSAASSSASSMSSNSFSSGPSQSQSASVPLLSVLGSSASTSAFVLPSVPAKLRANRAERRPDHVVKRRFHNSCHVCKCGASPGVEHVRCRCGIMFCGRPRCCKRLGVEWSVFVKELMAGGQCAHCNSLTPAGVADGVQCPNSNCKQKKKKGQESRKYSVGVVTSAQEVTPFSAAAASLPGLGSALAVGMKGAGGGLGADSSPSLSQMALSSFVPSIGSLSLQSNLPTVANSNPIASLPLSQILALLGQQQQQQQASAVMLPGSVSSLAPLSLSLAASSPPQPLVSPHHSHAPSLHQQQQAAAAALIAAASVSAPSPSLSALQGGLGGALPDGLSLSAAQLKLLQTHLQFSQPAFSPFNPQSATAHSHPSSLSQSLQQASQSLHLQPHSHSQSYPHSHSQSQSPHSHSPTTQRITDSAIAALLQANQQQQLQALHNTHMRMQQQQQQQQPLYPPVAPIGSFSSAASSSPAPPPSSASPPVSIEELLAALIRQQNAQPHSQPSHLSHTAQQLQQHHSHQHQTLSQPHHSHPHAQSHASHVAPHHSPASQSFGGVPASGSLTAAYTRQTSGPGPSGGDVVLSNIQLPAAYTSSPFSSQTNSSTASSATGPLAVQPAFSHSSHSHSLSAAASLPSASFILSSSPSLPAPSYTPPTVSSSSQPTAGSSDGAHEDDRGGKWRKKMKREEWSAGPRSAGSGSGGNSSGASTSNPVTGSDHPLSNATTTGLMDGASPNGV